MSAPAAEVDQTFTTAEVAHWLRCSRAKVYSIAKAHGIGINLGGSAGYRFTEADKKALRDALRPTAAAATASKRPRKPRRRR